MFKDWFKIFTPDCLVIVLSSKLNVYPIFKNGFTSLEKYAKLNHCKILKNKELSNLEEIQVFLRNPIERFISGVHTAIEYNNIKNEEVYLKQIENLKTYDRHFIPQIYWLFHLFKYFKKKVKISSVQELYELIPIRKSPDIAKLLTSRRNKIFAVKKDPYVDADIKLMSKYLGKTVELEKIVKDFKNVLSSS